MPADLHEAVRAKAASEERSMAQGIHLALHAYAERVDLKSDLSHAVALRQLELLYQPIVRLPQGPVEGVEALVRWAHPVEGLLKPALFIPLAEETGLIRGLGSWVLEESVSELASWRRHASDIEDLYVSVNISGVQLRDEHFVETVSDMLSLHGLEPSALCLEVPEVVLLEDREAACEILSRLRAIGVRICVDRFGTDFTSMAHLKSFPATSVKIDRSYVESLAFDDSADATMVAAIAPMARSLGMEPIAVGVETPVQAERLQELGCESVQGYVYSRPVTPGRVRQMLGDQSAPGLKLVSS